MTKATQNTVAITALAALSLTLLIVWVKGRQVFNRSLAADVIDSYVGRKIIDRGNENQDSYLFAWWYAITKGAPTFFHGGNTFLTTTGDFQRG